MIKTIQTFKNELMRGKKEYDEEARKLTQMVSVYAVQNEQLVQANRKLQDKVKEIQKKEREKFNLISEQLSIQNNKLKMKIKQT